MAAVSFPDFSGNTLADGRYILIHVVGAGSYGKVYKAIDTQSLEKPLVAIKCLQKPIPGSHHETFQMREFALHQKVSSHPNVITFHGHIFAGDFIFVVLDLCDGGDLFQAITQKDYFTNNDTRIKSAMVQLIDALDYCHKNNVFHRDLKPENVLFDKDAHLYLADFGLGTDKRISGDFCCGSGFYLSPEGIGAQTGRQRFSTIHSDIWALGVIMTNMLTGRNPWRRALTTDGGFRTFFEDPGYLYKALPISKSAAEILQGMFKINSLARTPLSTLREQIIAADTFFRPPQEMTLESAFGDEFIQPMSRGFMAPLGHGFIEQLPPFPLMGGLSRKLL
ncbi:kinase-like domain-containing protein [Mycena floridula]|nr:kinase-like domain-containing protein [Mycena floridula]